MHPCTQSHICISLSTVPATHTGRVGAQDTGGLDQGPTPNTNTVAAFVEVRITV